jgi:hypothetical protein
MAPFRRRDGTAAARDPPSETRPSEIRPSENSAWSNRTGDVTKGVPFVCALCDNEESQV